MHSVKVNLHPEELASLGCLAREKGKAIICGNHCRKLIQAGFASFHTGTLLITMTGYARLVAETTRANWLSCAARMPVGA